MCRCEAGIAAAIPVRQSSQQEGDDQLLQSFSDFISVFEAHVQHHGRVHLPKPQRIADLLQELQASLVPPSVSPPPTYAEVVPYSYLQSRSRSSSELLHLRRENEQLRQVQRQCERLSAQLQESQVGPWTNYIRMHRKLLLYIDRTDSLGFSLWGTGPDLSLWGTRFHLSLWGTRFLGTRLVIMGDPRNWDQTSHYGDPIPIPWAQTSHYGGPNSLGSDFSLWGTRFQ